MKNTVALDGTSARFATGYVKANLWSVLAGGSESISIGALDVDLEGRTTWAELGLGFTADAGADLSVYADGDVEFDVDGQDFWALTGKAGLRLNW